MPPASSYSLRRSSNGRNVARPWAPTKVRSPLPPPPPPRLVAPPPPPPRLVAPPPPPPRGLVPPPPPPLPLPPLSPSQKYRYNYEGNECVSSPSRPPTVSTAFSSGSGSDSDSPVPKIPTVFRSIAQLPPPPPNARQLPPTISMPSPRRAPSPSGKICFPLPTPTQSMAEDDNSTNSMRIPNFKLDEDLSHLSVGSDSCKTEEEKKNDPEEDCTTSERNRAKCLAQERDFWSSTVTRRNVTLGSNHVRTAEAVINLGIAEMRCKDYEKAVSCFQSAGRIYKKLYGPSNLGLAKALDKIGHAASQKDPARPERLTFALDSLEEAFKIRTELLGPSHVDTVETLNNMAGVYLKLDKLQIAKQTFHDVLMKRIAIFDQMHPSVAVTAHTLASIHVSLKEVEEAYHFFNFAYAVYRAVGLSEGHPLLAGIMREVADLDSAAYRISL